MLTSPGFFFKEANLYITAFRITSRKRIAKTVISVQTSMYRTLGLYLLENCRQNVDKQKLVQIPECNCR